MAGFTQYIGAIFSRAAKGPILLTDRLTVLIIPFTTLVLWALGAKMTDSLQETLLLGVAMTVVAVVTLRLIAASYSVWRDDQSEKEALRAELNAPERESEIAMKEYVVELRKKLSESLGRLAGYSVRPKSWRDTDDAGASDCLSLILEIEGLINQLSYDTALRIAAVRFRHQCLKMLTGEASEDRNFWRQRQITFRLLHKENWVSDIMSLMELELLLEEMGETDLTESPEDGKPIEQLKALMRELGDGYHDPEVRERLKKALKPTA